MGTMTEQLKGWRLFLDDERSPTWDLGEVLIARDCDEAIALVKELGVPEWISFDHDLGKFDTGVTKPVATTFLWWLIEQDLDGNLDLSEIKRIIVHSRNESGARNIAELWNGYALNELKSDVRAELRPRATLTK